MAGAEQKDILNDLRDSIIEMDFGKASAAARSALAAGMDPAVIIDEGLGKGMERISDEFNEGKIFLPQILAASMAMEAALQEITPVLEKNAGKLKGVIVMGSVQGDIHEIGKSVCCAMLRRGIQGHRPGGRCKSRQVHRCGPGEPRRHNRGIRTDDDYPGGTEGYHTSYKGGERVLQDRRRRGTLQSGMV